MMCFYLYSQENIFNQTRVRFLVTSMELERSVIIELWRDKEPAKFKVFCIKY